MTSTNNNQNNQADITDLEFGSFNEEDDQFINKKQLVHIEDDTSINVDMSEDDRSKSSSLKKSFFINNISALNEQFPNNNEINSKKNDNDKEIEINDINNSADFYNSQNRLENIPETIEEQNKNNNINNDEIIQSLETKIDNNGFLYSRKSKEILDSNINNNLKNIINHKIINDDNNKNIDDEVENEEEEDINDNLEENININNDKNNIRTSQMVIKKKLTPNEIINKYITNQNINNYNEEFFQNNINSNGKKYPNINSNNIYLDSLEKENFYFNIMNSQIKLSGSVNTSEQTFGLIQSREYQNKYAQLEAKYNTLLSEKKKLEENYIELKNSNKSVLDLLTYWQKFYLEILEIVKPKNQIKNNDNSISDYMDDPYRIQVINDVKKIVLISRDKAYNNFFISPIKQLEIKSNKKEKQHNMENNGIINNANKNISLNNIESFFIKANNKKNVKNNNKDDINSLPPIRHIEKINIGINTDINNDHKPKQIIKFDNKNLSISSNIQNISYINKNPKKLNSNKNNNQNLKSENKKKYNILKINSNIKLNFKGIIQKSQKKLKKNIMHKIAMVQTDLTYKNINSIETLNKACSSQLLNAQKEKEKMQKLYEEKISSLNHYINDNIKHAKKEKNKNSKNKEKEEKEKEELIQNLNSSFIFLPEMIPPENTYKIFIHCVKHFKYEEDIYKKYLEEEDLYTLKAFVEKIEKFFNKTSLPLLKNKSNKNKNDDKSKEIKEKKFYTINNDFDDINEENILIKKLKENKNIHNNKQKFADTKLKLSNNSENKIKIGENKKSNIYNNNNTFNKYKAAIMALKDY